MNKILPTWRLFFPDLICIRDLYRIDRSYIDLHGHTRLQSLRVALWWDRHARHSALTARLGL